MLEANGATGLVTLPPPSELKIFLILATDFNSLNPATIPIIAGATIIALAANFPNPLAMLAISLPPPKFCKSDLNPSASGFNLDKAGPICPPNPFMNPLIAWGALSAIVPVSFINPFWKVLNADVSDMVLAIVSFKLSNACPIVCGVVAIF